LEAADAGALAGTAGFAADATGERDAGEAVGAPVVAEPGVPDDGATAGLGDAAGLGGEGFSGLIPPSHEGPEYISAASPLPFHFSSKSAAALFGVSPAPTTSFHG